MRLKKLNALIIGSFLRTFVPTFVVVMFILLMQFIWLYVDELVGKGLEWHVIAELLFYWSASLIPQAMPLAVLLASIMTFGNLGETYELVAAKAAGISIWKMFRPMFVVMFLVALFGFFVSNVLIPEANLKSRTLLHDVRQKRPAVAIVEGVFYSGIDGMTIRVGKKDRNTQELRDIIIYDHRGNTAYSTVITAERGTMTMSLDNSMLFFNLYNGARYEEMENQRDYYQKFPHTSTFFTREEIAFDLTALNFKRTDEELFKQNFEMLNILQLSFFTDSLQQIQVTKAKDLVDFMKPYYAFVREQNDSNFGKSVPFTLANNSTNLLTHIGKEYDKTQVLSTAESSARSVKNIISYATNERKDIVRNLARYEIEWHRKFILSIACIVMFFIGAPLGSIIRKGGFGLPVVVSVLLYLTYHIISLSGEKAAKTLAWTPVAGMWLAVSVLMPLGMFLSVQASNDSNLFDIKAWGSLFRFFKPRKRNLQ